MDSTKSYENMTTDSVVNTSSSSFHNVTAAEAVSSNPWLAVNIIACIIGCIGFITNLFVCVVFMLHKPLKKRLPNYFLLNQSIIDLFAGLVLIISIWEPVVTTDESVFNISCYLILQHLIFLGLFVASTWNLAALSFERYLEIVHPIRHKLSLTSNKVLVTCVLVWIFGFISQFVVILPVTQIRNARYQSGLYVSVLGRRLIGIYIISTEFIIPLCIIAYCYFKMWQAVQKITNTPSTGTSSHSQIVYTRKNIAKLLAIISVLFVLTVGPRQLLMLSIAMNPSNANPNEVVFSACLVANYLNCCINPLLYMFKYAEFQKGVKGIFGKKTATVAIIEVGARRLNVNVF